MPNERSAQFDNSLLCRQTENEATFVPHDVSAATSMSMSKYYASRMSAQSINNWSQFCLFSSCKIQLERTQAEKELRNSLTHTLAGVYHCNANEGSAHRTLSLSLSLSLSVCATLVLHKTRWGCSSNSNGNKNNLMPWEMLGACVAKANHCVRGGGGVGKEATTTLILSVSQTLPTTATKLWIWINHFTQIAKAKIKKQNKQNKIKSKEINIKYI